MGPPIVALLVTCWLLAACQTPAPRPLPDPGPRPHEVTPASEDLIGYIADAPEDVKPARFAQANACFMDAATPDRPASLAEFLVDAGRYPALEAEVVACMEGRFGLDLR